MGSFFATLNVRIARPDALDVLATRLRDAIVGGTYIDEVCSRDPDRTVLIARKDGSPWLTVLDEDSDAPDADELQRLACSVTGEDGVAVGAIVADSDTLELSLFRERVRLDRVRFDPARSRRPRIKREAWRSALGDAATEALTSSLKSGGAFAEAPVEALSAALGWGDAALLGYGHRDELDAAEVRELRFWLREGARPFSFVEGPPRLWTNSSELGRETAKIGGRARLLHLLVYNQGGSSVGVHVFIVCSQEHSRMLRFDSVRILVGEMKERFEAPTEPVEWEGKIAVRATFPQLPLAPYVTWNEQREITPAELMKGNDVMQRARLRVSIDGTALAPGLAEAMVFLAPHESGAKGATGRKFEITVREEGD